MGTVGVKGRLQAMDDYDFEHFVADLWEWQGWDCEVSQVSNDAGIDVTATKQIPYQQKKLIQAKRYGPNTTVGSRDIQQYASLKHQVADADSVVVVTTSTFTSPAKERAQELNVKAVDGDTLVRMVESLNAYDLLEEYTGLRPVGDSEPTATSSVVGESIRTDEATTGVDYDSTSVQQGDGVFSPSKSPQWLENLERSRHWHRLIPAGIAVWFVALFIAAALEGTAVNIVADLIGYGIVVPGYVVLPGMWYLDMRYIRSVSDWDIDARKWLVGGILLPPFVVPYYYYRRYSVLGL